MKVLVSSSSNLRRRKNPDPKVVLFFEIKRRRVVVASMLLLALTTMIRVEAQARSAFAIRSGSIFLAFVGSQNHLASAFSGIRQSIHGGAKRELRSGRIQTTTASPCPLAFPPTKPLVCCQFRVYSSSLNALRKNGGDGDSMRSETEESIPLVFLHGIKGSHLAFLGTNGDVKPQRSWLTLGGLLNFPPRDDHDPERDISLPLSYTFQKADGDGTNITSAPIQDKGRHFVDGTVDHVVELTGMLPGKGGALLSNTGNLDFFPFYGHATKFLEKVNDAYNANTDRNGCGNRNEIGSDTDQEQQDGSIAKIMEPRPTRTFSYDWRRNLSELSEEFHEFCETEFPGGRPVQVVAHSLGGLIAYTAMKKHPEKYKPGGVLVGVPFGTGIQYFQDMHKGYFTELGTCRQFLPPVQFTFSSHWMFFPQIQEDIGDSFVDVSEYFSSDGESDDDTIAFEADRSTIGKKISSPADDEESKWRPASPGKPIEIDFYDPDEWEKNEIGIFDPAYRHKIDQDDKGKISEYKQHMKLQLEEARAWRNTVLAPWEDEKVARKKMPPLTICSTNSIPTVNQILRRKRRARATSDAAEKFFSRSLLSLLEKATKQEGKVAEAKSFPRSFLSLLEKATEKDNLKKDKIPACQWEYDYASGRTVPGDGRIDYDKSFPPLGTLFKTVDLGSLHAKQFCWEESGGDLGKVWKEVNEQLKEYQSRDSAERVKKKDSLHPTGRR